VLHSEGGVWLNGNEVSGTLAIFPGDTIETKPGLIANLEAQGSSVLIQGQSVVKLEKNYLILDHGSLTVVTSTLMSVHVNCMDVKPISGTQTQYDVTDVSGTLRVVAHKSDVNITRGSEREKASAGKNTSSQSATVREGERATRDDSTVCGIAARPGEASTGLHSKWIEIGGGGAGAVALCLILCRGSSPQALSPSQP
jgi:hypothetical protein